MSETQAENNAPSSRALKVLFNVTCLGLICVIFFAFQTISTKEFFSVSFAALLMSGASLLVGGILGFLFGIPRTLQTTEPSEEDSQINSVYYRANTNLEQISDWLTKILVGVGLTQLTLIPSQLQNFGKAMGPALGTSPTAPLMAISILVFFSVTGFLFGFLWTRLYLATAFREADINQLMDRVNETDKKMNALQQQSKLDAEALTLVTLQLTPDAVDETVTQEALNEAVSQASDSVRAQIYSQAWSVRHENWQNPNNKPLMERTIPVFRALLHSKAGQQFHQSYAQLGYALKDQTNPDWEQAELNLSQAIKLRNEDSATGWGYYDLNRGFCRIKTDPDYLRGSPSEANQRELILDDLREAWSRGRQENIQNDGEIQNWMRINGVSAFDLETPPG